MATPSCSEGDGEWAPGGGQHGPECAIPRVRIRAWELPVNVEMGVCVKQWSSDNLERG